MLRSAFGKLSLVTLLLFFANFSSFAQSGPGGVISSLWLRADSAVFSDAGTTPAVDTDPVVQWNDVSGIGNNASVGGANPTFQIGGQNGRPYLSFSDDDMDFALDGFAFGSVDRSVLVVAEYPSTPGSQQYFFSYGPNVTSQRYSLGVSPSDNLIVEMQGDGITSDNTVSAASPFIFSTIYPFGGALSTSQIFINGTNSTHTGGAATPATVETSGSVGALADNAGLQFNGDIYEVIYYDFELFAMQRTIVENYLSAKYDIPISNDLYAGDLAPSGDFDFDVIGIGRDAGVSHIESASAGLKLVDQSFLLDDGDYVFAGHSGTPNAFATTDLPANHNMRLARDWYIDISDATSNAGSIDLEFDLAEMGLSVPPNVVSAMLITRPGTSGAYTEVIMGGIIGDVVEFFGVDVTTLVDGHKYTVAFATENALNFDGTDDNVNITHNASLNLDDGAFTIEYWARPETVDGNFHWIMSKSTVGNGSIEFITGIDVTNQWRFGLRGLNMDIVGTSTVVANQYYHIACVFDGTEARLFVNGSLEGTASLSGSAVVGSEDIVIGARNASAPTQFFDGTIDEVRFWNTDRTQQQIHDNAYLDVSSDPDLIAYYNFNQGVSASDNSGVNTLPDVSGNANFGSLNGPFALSGATSNWVASTAWAADVFPPTILSASTQDTDQNGQIDLISILFSEDLDGPSVTDGPPEFTLGGGYVISGTALNGTDGVDLTLTESGSPDTDQTPAITMIAATLLDLNGVSNTSQIITPNDEAAPGFLSGTPTATVITIDGFTLNVEVSEDGGQVAYSILTNPSSPPGSLDDIGTVGVASGIISTPLAETGYQEVVAGLSQGTSYDIYLLPYDGLGNRQAATTDIINTVTATPPLAPTDLIAYATSSTDITLEWADNSSDETGFIIESSPDLAFGSPTDITSAVTPPNPGPDVTSVVYTAGVDESLYFRVSSTNSNGTSPSSVAFATTEAFAGHALSFDGTDDSVVVPHDPQLNLVSGDFAIEAWVYLNASGSQTIASKGDGNGIATDDAWIFQIQGDKIALQLVDGVSTSEWGLSTTNVPLNEWVHVAVSFTGTTASFYLNGVADGTLNYGFSPSDNGDSQSMYMARQGSICDCNYLNGDLDELKIWSAVKSDFSDRYSLVDLSIPQPNLVAYYSFDEGVGATNTVDASANINDGSISGATSIPSTVVQDGVVSNTNNAGPGSLRAAIEYANANPGTTITFNIAGGGPYSIALTTAIPEITNAGTIIDGTTQPGWTFNISNMVTIDGSGLALNEGGLVVNNVANVEIYGLAFTGFTSSSESVGGIEFNGDGADNGIIGSPNNGNIFHGMNSSGIAVTHADFLTIQGNWFGTTDGTARSEIGKHGIYTSGTVDNLTIGGLSGSGEGNLISGAGNGRYGIRSLAQGTNLVIQGNYIGTTSNGMADLHNEGGGIEIGGAMTFLLGGITAGQENIISGNNTDANAKGVLIGTSPDGSIVNNIIGLAVDGIGPLGNGGPGIILNTTSAGVVVDGNIISSNGGEAITSNTGFGNVDIINNIIGFDQTVTNPRPNAAGVVIDNGAGTNNRFGYKDNPNIIANNTGSAIELTATSADNTFVTNEIYNNTSGIVLAAGANGDVAVPTIDNVSASTVSGSGVEGATIHLYLSDGTGQGQTFLDSAVVSGGNWSIGGLSLIITDEVVATTTNYNPGFGTSTFSATASIPVQYALDFDGTDDHAVLSGNAFGAPYTGDFTVEAWVYSDLSGNNGNGSGSYGSAIFKNMESGSGATGDLALTINNIGQIGLLNWRENAVDADGHTQTLDSIAPNTWTHVAATWDGAVNRIYINGVEKSTIQNGTSTSWGAGYEIGRTHTATQWHYDGEMDELRVWNVARNETEINDNLYTELNPGSETNLVAYYQFNSASGTNVIDSKNANDGVWDGTGGSNTTPNWIPSTALTQPPNIVTNVNDAGPGSLREAIIYANANPGTTITFDIPGGAPWEINLASDLPDLTAQGTIIDATTQPGWNINSSEIPMINGGGTGSIGLNFTSNNEVEVYGLHITGFTVAGIRFNVVGGSPNGYTIGATNKGNIITDAGSAGLSILSYLGGGSIQGNYIGIMPDSTAGWMSNTNGISLGTNADNAQIGGLTPGEENVISNNTTSEISISGGDNAIVQGNIIGLTPDESAAAGAGNGVNINGSDGATIEQNVISGHTTGIRFNNSSGHTIIRNNIGVSSDGSTPFPNFNGIHMINNLNSDNNIIGSNTITGDGNIIAENTTNAILIEGSGNNGNQIQRNAMFNNAAGITLNSGAHNGIAPPAIDPITDGSTVTGTGTDGDIIDLYYDDSNGQGNIHLGSATVSSGNWSIGSLSLTGGDRVVATATNATDGTSEFSASATYTFNYPSAEGAGEALYFDGIDDYVDISSFDVAGWNEIMVEAWIKPDVIPGGPGDQYATIVGKGSYGAAGNTSFALYLFGSDGSPFSELRARVDNGTQEEEVTYDANNLFAGEWVHVAMSWTSGNAVELYVNGELVDSSSPLSGTINAVGDNILIGSSSNGSELLFEGEIDEVKIWDKRLQENGIRQYLAKKVTDTHPDFSNLVAYYRMDDSGDALNLTDYKGVHNGTVEGGSSYVLSGAHLGDYSTYEYSYGAGSGRGLDNFRVENLGTDNLPLHIYRVSGTPANNTIAGFDNIADTAYYGVFAPGQTYDVVDSIGNLTVDRRIVFRTDGADPTWTSISGPLGTDVEDDQIYAYGQFDNGQFATAIDQNPYPTPVDAGYALSFNGSNYVTIQDFDFSSNDQLTLEAWVNPNSLSGAYSTVVRQERSGLFADWFLSVDASNIRFQVRAGSVLEHAVSYTLPLNQWSHVAGVYDGAQLHIYVNGIEIASPVALTGNIAYNPTPIHSIGAYSNDGGSSFNEYFDGQLDEVRVWDVALSETNIRDHMIAKIDADFDSLNHLVAYFRFDENSGATAANLAGDADGTVTGATPVISGVPQGQGSIYSYQGTPGVLNTAQFGEDINVFYDDATGGIHGYVVQGNPNQLQADGFDDLDQGKYYGVFAPGGQKVDIRMDYNGANDSQRRIVYRKDASDNAASGGWERLSGLLNTRDAADSVFAYHVPSGEVSTAVLNPASSYLLLGDTDPGSALDFDGTDDYVEVPNSESLNFEFDDPISIEAWINTPTSGTWTVFSKVTAGPTRGYRITLNSQVPSFQLFNDGGASNEIVVSTVETIPLTSWHHLTVTYDGSNTAAGVKFYLDGVLLTNSVANDNLSGTIQNTGNVFIGIRNDLTSPYQGQIDELRIWNAEVSAGDISAYSNTTDISSHPNYSDMVAYYKFDDGTGSTILEDVFANNDGTLTNMDENTDWVGSGALANAPQENALNFDGSDDYLSFTRQAFPTGLTYEAWINTTSTANTTLYNGNPALVVVGDNDNSVEGAFGVHDGKVRYTHWQGSATNFDQIDGTAIVNDGLWHHIAVTHDQGSNEVRLYVDGVLDTIAISTNYFTTVAANRVGSSYLDGSGNDNFFVGDIDEVRIWDTVIDEAEIRNYLYANNLGSHPNNTNLVLHYNFNQGDAGNNNTGETTVADQSSNTLDGTLNGFTLNGASSNFISSNAFVHTPAASSIQATNISVSNVTETTADITWTNGDGQRRIVALFEGIETEMPIPSDNQFFGADPMFLGDGDIVDGTWYAVYNGYGDSVSVTGLTAGQDYTIAVLEVNGPAGQEAYNSGADTDNPLNFTTNAANTNTALEFEPSSEYVSIPDDPVFDMDGDWTIEAWIKTPSTGQESIVTQISGNTGYSLFKIGGTLYFQYYSSGGFQNGATSLSAAAGIDDDQWHHIAVSQNVNNGKIYVDGVPVFTSNSMIGIDEPSTPIRLGYDAFVGNLTGVLDEVRFWDYQLTDGEILANFDSELVGNESGLVAYYPFLDGTGSTNVTDITSGSNDATLINMDENTDWVTGPVLSQPVIPDATFNTINVTGANLTPGSADNLVYKFSISATGGDITKEGMIVAVGGDAVAADFSTNGWKLYESANVDTGIGGASLVGSTNIGDVAVDSVGFAMSGDILDGDIHYFYLAVDIDASATVGNAFNVMLWSPDPLETIGIANPKNKVDGGFIDGETFTIQSGDVTPPTPIISSAESDPTNVNPIVIDFDFGESVTGFAQNDITVSNGTKQNFNNVDGQTYTVEIVPTSDGLITIDIAAGRAQDLAGNGNLVAAQFAINYDGTSPTPIITSSEGSTTNVNPIVIDFDFGESVTGFAQNDITVSNGSKQNFNNVDDQTYTIEIVPSVDGLITFDIAAGRAQDLAGNGNLVATQFAINYDGTGPSITLDQDGLTVNDTNLSGTISDPTDVIQISVDGGTTLSNVSNEADGTWSYPLDTDPNYSGDGIYNIYLDAVDLLGNQTLFTTGSVTIDQTAPIVTVDETGTSIRNPLITGEIDDPLATIEIEVDGESVTATNNGDGTWALLAGSLSSGLPDGTYDVIATATDEAGNVGSDNTTDELIISQTIIALSASDINSTGFTARWSTGQDVQTYQVDISTSSDFTTFVEGFEDFETTATGVFVTNLDFSTNYYYRVRLVNTNDVVSENSNTRNVKTTVDPETLADSLALVQIYEAIDPQGLNWETERLRIWDGVTLDFNKTRVDIVNISGTEAVGDMPNPFTGDALTNGGLNSMTGMDVSDNEITGLMDFSSTSLSTLFVNLNNLEFDDLEPIAELNITTLDYADQSSIQFNETTDGSAIEVRYTNDYSLSADVGGNENQYNWFRNDNEITTGSGFIISGSEAVIDSINYNNMGEFRVEVTSTLVPGLTIDVDPQVVWAVADMQVSVSDSEGNSLSAPLDATMLETTRTKTGFRELEKLEGVNSSTFTFPDVVLGNYIIFVESDLEFYIPTYYGDVFEWTEADTLFFRSDDVIEMTMTEVPPELVEGDGDGTLDVLIEEDFGEDDARIDARRRAAKRKCGLRRKTGGGRTGQDDDEYELIAYGETDENGEFQFGFLPEGTYRFFVEYPGIPIDESSFVEFEVGEAGVSDTDFKLAAFATEDGIEISIEAVLGIILEYFKDLQIYPNPSSDYLNIRYRHLKSNDVIAQLVDLAGNTKWSQDLRNGFDGELKVDVSEYEEGIYILRFYDRESPKDNVVSFRVIVRN